MVVKLKNGNVVDMEQLHKVQLVILDKLDAVCKKYGLNYFLAFGTLIGAIRNDGFIPWDDDIDVVMLYSDYKKLQKLPKSEWGEDFFLQYKDTDPEFAECYTKLRKNGSTLISEETKTKDINQGIYINIYPLISVPDGEKEKKWQKRRSHMNMLLTANKPCDNYGSIVKGLSKLILNMMSGSMKDWIIHRNMKKITAYENSGAQEVFAYAKSPSLGLTVKKEYFQHAVPHKFESRELLIPSGYHDWLTLRYGEYMELPPEEHRIPQISDYILVDTEKPFTYYKGSLYCTDNASANKSAKGNESLQKKSTPAFVNFIEYIALLVIILAIWQIAEMTGRISPLTLPSLESIVTRFIKLVSDGTLISSIGISISRVLKGYAVASIVSITLGVFIGLSTHFKKLTALIIQILKPIPPIAWIPLVILWFGIGEESKVFLIFIGSFFTILTNVVDGIRQTDIKLIELSRVMETPKLKHIFRVVIPSAAPSIFTGLRVGLGQSWMCVVAAELVASSTGVGYMIMNARQFGQTDVVIVGMLTIGIIGKIMDSLLTVLEKKVIRWM